MPRVKGGESKRPATLERRRPLASRDFLPQDPLRGLAVIRPPEANTGPASAALPQADTLIGRGHCGSRTANWMGKLIHTGTVFVPFNAGVNRRSEATRIAASSRALCPELSLSAAFRTFPSSPM